MAGSVVDLTDPFVRLPSPIVVDSNIIIERIAASLGHRSHQINGPRAHDFFSRLNRDKATGFVTRAGHAEIAHVLVRLRYQSELRSNRSALTQQFGPLSSWKELYKRDPSILQGMRSDFALLSHQMVTSGIYFLNADDLHPIASGNTSDQELIEVMCRYGLDSTDATIHSEAERIPVLEIATLDADLLRAQTDFIIYTWR